MMHSSINNVYLFQIRQFNKMLTVCNCFYVLLLSEIFATRLKATAAANSTKRKKSIISKIKKLPILFHCRLSIKSLMKSSLCFFSLQCQNIYFAKNKENTQKKL